MSKIYRLTSTELIEQLVKEHRLQDLGDVYFNLSVPHLVEYIVKREEGKIAECGAVVAYTGRHTGRSPKDRFIVREPSSEGNVCWGDVNRPISQRAFDTLYGKIADFFRGKDVFVRDMFVCAHPNYRFPIRIINEFAWHNLFANNLFLRPAAQKLPHNEVGLTVICAPSVVADPDIDETNSETFILLNLKKRVVLIGGTRYAGEIKKSVFSVLNYLLPEKGVFPMHCAANMGEKGDVALFFGLSGTGKTTLSADPQRKLIGDDEHGWFDSGVFNFEGGCYAKVIKLDPHLEPEIYKATLHFGTVVENVEIDELTRKIDFNSDRYTENTRSAYPLEALSNVVREGMGGIPKTIFMLSYDAFGVLPPISKLTCKQAIYYFLLGYTARVAGTERGVKEPQATFSPCFGAPFLPRPPVFYAKMLWEKLKKYQVNVWLLNTGILGGSYGVGKRIPLAYTRALVKAALDGSLEAGGFVEVPILKLLVPKVCPGVDEKILQPRFTWNDPSEYDLKAKELVKRFEMEYKKYNFEVSD